jgi:hypothetical protein
MMKGQAVSHAIGVALSVALIVVVVAAFSSVSKDYEDFIIANEAGEICSLVKTGVDKIHKEHVYESELVIDTPKKIAGKKYRIRFGDNLSIEIMGSNRTESCSVGIEKNFSGSVSGGRIKLLYNSSGLYAEPIR